ncbi:hypothetical protein GCM10027443_00620 [Pontibacter brevis]
MFLASCEDGVFEPQSFSNCREISQWNDRGLRIDRIYDGKKVTKIEYYNNEVLQYYYEFTYDNNGRIVESQYVNVVNNTQSIPEIISYNDKGKWAQSTFTYPNGDITTQSVEYDNQDQIKKLTSAINRSGTSTENYTVTYAWEGGNNIGYTYTSPTSQTVVEYEFNLEQANKRRKEQEKLSFFSISVPYSRNMLQRAVSTTTSGGTTTRTVNEYNYELDENGYPYTVTRTVTGSASTSPSSITTYFDFDCN